MTDEMLNFYDKAHSFGEVCSEGCMVCALVKEIRRLQDIIAEAYQQAGAICADDPRTEEVGWVALLDLLAGVDK